jgi:uncharacterized protein
MRSDEVTIPVAGATLAGTLLVPEVEGRGMGAVLIAGSGAHDRDESVCGHAPFRVIAEHLARRGVAVLRCDDRGVGGSTGEAEERSFEETVDDTVARARWLAQREEIDPRRIVLIGHSEGGLVAARAARDAGAMAIVALAGPATPIEAMLHEQARRLSLEGGATPEQIDHERSMNEAVFGIARSSRDHADARDAIDAAIRDALRRWPGAELDESTIVESAAAMASVVSAPAYRSLLRQDPGAALADLACPIFAAFGERDAQVPGPESAAACARILAGRERCLVRLFEGHNHLFQRCVTGAIAEYETLGASPSEEVLQAISDWLASLWQPVRSPA